MLVKRLYLYEVRSLWCWWWPAATRSSSSFERLHVVSSFQSFVIDHVLLAFRICTCKKSKRVMRTTAWNSINKWHTDDHVTIKHRPTVWKFFKFINFRFQLSKHANFDRLWRFSHFGFRSGFRQRRLEFQHRTIENKVEIKSFWLL